MSLPRPRPLVLDGVLTASALAPGASENRFPTAWGAYCCSSSWSCLRLWQQIDAFRARVHPGLDRPALGRHMDIYMRAGRRGGSLVVTTEISAASGRNTRKHTEHQLAEERMVIARQALVLRYLVTSQKSPRAGTDRATT